MNPRGRGKDSMRVLASAADAGTSSPAGTRRPAPLAMVQDDDDGPRSARGKRGAPSEPPLTSPRRRRRGEDGVSIDVPEHSAVEAGLPIQPVPASMPAPAPTLSAPLPGVPAPVPTVPASVSSASVPASSSGRVSVPTIRPPRPPQRMPPPPMSLASGTLSPGTLPTPSTAAAIAAHQHAQGAGTGVPPLGAFDPANIPSGQIPESVSRHMQLINKLHEDLRVEDEAIERLAEQIQDSACSGQAKRNLTSQKSRHRSKKTALTWSLQLAEEQYKCATLDMYRMQKERQIWMMESQLNALNAENTSLREQADKQKAKESTESGKERTA